MDWVKFLAAVSHCWPLLSCQYLKPLVTSCKQMSTELRQSDLTVFSGQHASVWIHQGSGCPGERGQPPFFPHQLLSCLNTDMELPDLSVFQEKPETRIFTCLSQCLNVGLCCSQTFFFSSYPHFIIKGQRIFFSVLGICPGPCFVVFPCLHFPQKRRFIILAFFSLHSDVVKVYYLNQQSRLPSKEKVFLIVHPQN